MEQPRRRQWVMSAAVAAATVGLAASSPDPTPAPPVYEVTSVRGTLQREEPPPELELAVGARPAAGELLRTRRRSAAEIVAPEVGARFALGPSTRARLASSRPGVLLELERGRLRAVFDKLAADPPPARVVTTPSAVLAVRGTEYGVEVTRGGDTDVVVFAGTVVVRDATGAGAGVQVQAGYHLRVRRGQPLGKPEPHRLNPSDWDRGRRPPSAQRPVGWGPSANAPGQGPGGRTPGGPGTAPQARGSGRSGG